MDKDFFQKVKDIVENWHLNDEIDAEKSMNEIRILIDSEDEKTNADGVNDGK